MKPDETVCPLTGKPCLMPKHFSVTEIENGEVKTVKLCNFCGPQYIQRKEEEDGSPIENKKEEVKEEEKKEIEPIPFKGVQDFLDGIVKAITKDAPMPTGLPEKEPCPRCKTSLQDILNTTKLGCPYCYEHYSDELKAVLYHSHDGAVKHVGKVPKNWKPPEENIEQVEAKMQKAIDKEDYEEAARLRDKIKKLKEKKK